MSTTKLTPEEKAAKKKAAAEKKVAAGAKPLEKDATTAPAPAPVVETAPSSLSAMIHHDQTTRLTDCRGCGEYTVQHPETHCSVCQAAGKGR